MTFQDVITKIPGLKHYYPLSTDAKDVVGTAHGVNHGATFGKDGATFDGKSYIELPDNDDFSAATTGELTILVFATITNWKGAGASEYIHWMGKGVAGAHEYTFRHYVLNGTGEASSRQGRVSFYHFNPAGGLGAGSYVQDPMGSDERMVTGEVDKSNIYMFKNAVLKDTDALSGYSIKPVNTKTPVRLGTRDMSTGYLIGKLRRVAFFNRKLTAAELKTLWDARALEDGGGSTPSPPPPPPVDPPPPVPLPVGMVSIGSAQFHLAGVNMARETDALVRYTRAGGTTTGTNEYGFEATVSAAGKVTKVANGVGNAAVTKSGSVLSGHGKARAWLLANAKVGSVVTFPG
jgi:hypothetical protein